MLRQVSTYQGRSDFGLMLFDRDCQCDFDFDLIFDGIMGTELILGGPLTYLSMKLLFQCSDGPPIAQPLLIDTFYSMSLILKTTTHRNSFRRTHL